MAEQRAENVVSANRERIVTAGEVCAFLVLPHSEALVVLVRSGPTWPVTRQDSHEGSFAESALAYDHEGKVSAPLGNWIADNRTVSLGARSLSLC